MHSPTDQAVSGREIQITRKDHGWSIKIVSPDPEALHQPLTPEERTQVREEVKRAARVERAD